MLVGIGKATFTRKSSIGNRDFKVRGQMKLVEFYHTEEQT